MIDEAVPICDWIKVLQEISYNIDKRKYAEWVASIWPSPLPTKLAIVLTIGLGILFFVVDHSIIMTIVILGIVLLWVIKAFSHRPPPESGGNVPGPLRFDQGGLHWCDLKGHFKWSWSEVSRFEIGRVRKTGQIRILFSVPDDDRFDRVSRWVFRRPSKRIHGTICDIYEASLEEIADNLNKYRDRALVN